jgi:hypothetical protein
MLAGETFPCLRRTPGIIVCGFGLAVATPEGSRLAASYNCSRRLLDSMDFPEPWRAGMVMRACG